MKRIIYFLLVYIFFSNVEAVNVTYISENPYDCLIFSDIDGNVYMSCNRSMVYLPPDRDYVMTTGNSYFFVNYSKTNSLFSANNSISYSEKAIDMGKKIVGNIGLFFILILFTIMFVGVFIFLIKRIIRYLL